ncbi:transcription factor mef2A isoform X2 [Teleopsis dalmanni]|uniref:transcription factor mef2A isoform X2 n=1 Tax=Teleopsis dalmanni TaxID=139649 RepID=UPI0018CFADD6|nr:transcription factor mef2A isoform X2 [Teleopsis dalmanni]
MTVKLAKFFNNTAGTQPPPLPPPNPPITHNYYNATNHQLQHSHQQQHSHQHQQHYNVYTMQDDDDNMSMYSTTASIMTSRDHPFNNSQRPLLAERKPQLLNKKKYNAVNSNQMLQQQQQQQHQQKQHQQLQNQHQHQHQHHYQDQQQKSYISPYVQQQKRDSAKGLHGFNDFDILSQQYNKHLQSPHIGYPYGSPPSPTANSNDFVFDTLTTQVKHTASNLTSITAAVPRYGNINNYEYADYATPSYRNDINEAEYYSNKVQTSHSNIIASEKNYANVGNTSRFEDDFCNRHNMEYTTNYTEVKQNTNGPFIFGIPHEQQTDYSSRIPKAGRGFSDSTDTVISYDDENIAQNGQATMSTSDTSSSSRGSNSNNSNKGAKFLLRKRKSKKSTKDKELKTDKPKKAAIKCVVVGDGAVGKTNLILSYLENRFNPEHVPTASDIYNADVMVNDSPVHLTICDTAGQDTLDPLRELCYPDSDVFLLCFSVAKPETFHAIKTKWAPKFTKTKATLILVGTQADLRTNTNVLNKLQTKGEKPVTYTDAWDLATTIGAKYIETSSATQDKVKEVFDTAIWEGLVPKTLPPTPAPLWKKIFCLA